MKDFCLLYRSTCLHLSTHYKCDEWQCGKAQIIPKHPTDVVDVWKPPKEYQLNQISFTILNIYLCLTTKSLKLNNYDTDLLFILLFDIDVYDN